MVHKRGAGPTVEALEEALDAPLSNQPLSHSRKSPRLFTNIDLPVQW